MIIVAAAWMDLRGGRIKNRLIFIGLIAGWISQILNGFPRGVGSVIGGMVLPILLGWILFKIRVVGAGDLKLLSVIGCFHGSRGVLSCMLIIIFLAGLYGFVILLCRHQLVSAFSDFFQYLEEISYTRELLPYERGRREGRTIPLAVFIGSGYAIWRILPFFPSWVQQLFQLF